MLSPRWRKLFADFGSIRGRLVLVVAALAVGLLSTIAVTTAFSILSRDIRANYLGTNPASGILDIGHVDAKLVERVRSMRGVGAAEPLSIVESRFHRPDGGNGRALLFVSADPLAQTLNTPKLETRLDPFPANGVYLERRALNLAKVVPGDSIELEIPGAGFVRLPVGGAVFDPSLAPASQEQTVYVYLDQATFTALGGSPDFELIRLQVSDGQFDQTHVDRTLVSVASALKADGVNVHLVQSPKAGMHPHEGQMRGVLMLFLAFGILAFLLSTVLVSVTVEGLLAQQVKQIAIQKTIGGRTGQIALPYLAGILALAALTLVIALPVGTALGRQLADAVAQLLNLDILSPNPPAWLWAFWIGAGLTVPVLAALRPVLKATGMTVTSALSDRTIGRSASRTGFLWRLVGYAVSGQLLLSLRGAFRRRGRTLMILALLSLAGAMYLTARTVSESYQASIDIAAAERHHDAELRLTAPLHRQTLRAIVDAVREIGAARLYLREEAAADIQDGIALVRTYPDGGHGSLSLYAGPDDADLRHYKVLKGTLPAGDLKGRLVVNQSALPLLGNPEIGDTVRLSLDGRELDLPLAAVLRQYMTPASAFVSDADVVAATGEAGANAIRLNAVSAHDAAVEAAIADLETRVDVAGGGVAMAITDNLMDEAIRGHVEILIFLLFALGVLMSIVGFLGLTAAQGISVSERTREFGIIRAIGGQRRQIVSNLLTEGLIIAVASLPGALLISLPLSYLVDVIIGRMTFGMPLPFSFDLNALGIWSLVALAGAVVASLPPAHNASRLSVRETLAQQ